MENIPKPEITQEKIKGTKEFARHRKQSFWQIYFPMIVVLAILILIVVLMVITTLKGDPFGTHSKWADVILMAIISIASFFTLIIIAILGASIYYLGKGIHKTPELTNQAKFYVDFGAEKINQVMSAITAPIIKAGGAAKGAQQAINRITKKQTD